MAELIHERVRRLRREHGLSTSALSRRTPNPETGHPGVGQKTIEALEANPGRVPKAETIEALAHAFDESVDAYYEWPIAQAQRDAASTPGAERRKAVDAARKASQRRRDTQPTDQPGQPTKPKRGRAA